MRNKKIITLSLVTIILLVTIVAFLAIKNKPERNNTLLNNTQSSLQCAKEGETIGASGMPSSCCSDLKAVGGWSGGYNGDCKLPPPPTGLNTCTACGDNKCDIKNGENKCNCEEDCK
jgi:hypothetical protein